MEGWVGRDVTLRSRWMMLRACMYLMPHSTCVIGWVGGWVGGWEEEEGFRLGMDYSR